LRWFPAAGGLRKIVGGLHPRGLFARSRFRLSRRTFEDVQKIRPGPAEFPEKLMRYFDIASLFAFGFGELQVAALVEQDQGLL